AVTEYVALLAEQLLALLVGVAGLVARTGVVSRAGRDGVAGAELAGNVAGHAGARALRGRHRAADAVDAVTGLAGRRAGGRAARPVRARRAVGQVLPDLLRAVGRVALDVAAEHQRRRLERIEDLDLVVARQRLDAGRGRLRPGAGDAVPLPGVVL